MLKINYLTALALGATVALSSCTNDEVLDSQEPTKAAIGFDTFVDKSVRATEADDITLTKLKEASSSGFSVFAVVSAPDKTGTSQLFVNEQVKWTDGAFKYTPEKYWTEGCYYRFSAIAPYDVVTDVTSIDASTKASAILKVEQNTANIPVSDFDAGNVKGGLILTLNNQIANGDKDICYAFDTKKNFNAQTAATTDGYTTVKFQFTHLLSRVKFTFYNDMPSPNSAISISDIKITNPSISAKINKINADKYWTEVTGPTASDATNPFNLTFDLIKYQVTVGDRTFDTDKIAGGGTKSIGTTHHYIMPLNTQKVFNVSFKITLYNYEGETATYLDEYVHTQVTLPALQYEPNMSYNFVARIDETNIDPKGQLYPIKFDADVSPWTDYDTDTSNDAQDDPTVVFPQKETTGGETPATPQP